MQLTTLHTQTLTSKHGTWREHSDWASDRVVVMAMKIPRELTCALPQIKASGVCHGCWTESVKSESLQVMPSAYLPIYICQSTSDTASA